MPVNCSVPGCRNNSTNNPDVKFHSFPSDEELKYKWATVIKNGMPWGKPITPYTKVCSDHFDITSYSPSLSGLSMVLSKDAIPRPLRLPNSENEKVSESGSSEQQIETGKCNERVAAHLNAIRMMKKRRMNRKDARNYARDDTNWKKIGCSYGTTGHNQETMPETWKPKNISDREKVFLDSRVVGFMPVEVILQTCENFDLLETEIAS